MIEVMLKADAWVLFVCGLSLPIIVMQHCLHGSLPLNQMNECD